jgi:hypothetical protein
VKLAKIVAFMLEAGAVLLAEHLQNALDVTKVLRKIKASLPLRSTLPFKRERRRPILFRTGSGSSPSVTVPIRTIGEKPDDYTVQHVHVRKNAMKAAHPQGGLVGKLPKAEIVWRQADKALIG